MSWEEIKRLAADFQRTQTSEALQRISDRHCIDIVKKLTDLNLIRVIYTCDGKGLVTHEYLLQEIQDEIAFNGGRMQLHELAAKLNVDYQHVEDKAKELTKNYPDQYFLVLGQIIHKSYQSTLTKHIKEKLNNTGEVSLAGLAKNLDLPSDFISTMIAGIMKKIGDDYVLGPDGKTYYTQELMNRYEAIMAGTLSAIFKPTSIASILKRLDISEKLFNPLLDTILKSGRIDGHIENRQIVPAIYTKSQSQFIDKFYSHNSYITYEVVSRLDIKQPKVYLKKRFPESIFLTNLCIDPILIEQTESMIEETISDTAWLDVTTILPSSFEEADVEQIIQEIFKSKKLKSLAVLLNSTSICSNSFVDLCRQKLADKMPSKAEDHLKEGVLMQHFMGTPVQKKEKPVQKVTEEVPREVRKKAKSRAARRAVSSEREEEVASKPQPLEFMSTQEMFDVLKTQVQQQEDCPDEIIEVIVSRVEYKLNEDYSKVARETLDDFLRKQAEQKEEYNSPEDEVAVVE